jgi:hypothetical protein
MSAQTGLLALAVLTIIFNAGGFLWLAKNHMRHVQEALNDLTVRLGTVEQAVARIEGYCQANHSLN